MQLGSDAAHMMGIHPDLRRHTMVGFVASAVVGCIGLLVLVAIVVDSPLLDAMPLWLALVVAISFLVVGYVGTMFAPRWYRNASRVVSSAKPVPGSAVFRLDSLSDSTSLYARITISGEPVREEEIPLLIPAWDIAALLPGRTDILLYRHPATFRVVALRTPVGLLWAMPQAI